MSNNNIQIYQAENGEIILKKDLTKQTVWANQKQIAQIFGVNISAVNKHISHILNQAELDNSTVSVLEIVQNEGRREVKRKVEFYSLDMIISIGYRINNKKGTQFRKWANSILKDYIQKGYSINLKLLKSKQAQIEEIRKTLDFLVSNQLETADQFVEILSRYTKSLVILNQFDEGRLTLDKGEMGVLIEIDEFREIIKKTKIELMSQAEATVLFGHEVDAKFEASVAAVYQNFGGRDVYTSLEEKAANLLYLVIKNHGFIDGNKRIGSILFVYFLAKNKFLYRETGELKINDNTLVALALLIAQSKPEDKDTVIRLVVKLIQT